MRQRQITHDSVNFIPITLMVLIQGEFSPSIVIMGQHYSLWHSRRSTGIDQGATVTWFHSTHPLLHELNIDSVTLSDELIILDDFIRVFLLSEIGIVIDHNDVNITFF